MTFGLAHAKDLAIGGLGSPGGSIVWYVVGIEVSIRDWALRQGRAGRRMHPPLAQGLLVDAQDMLAAHFGLVPR